MHQCQAKAAQSSQSRPAKADLPLMLKAPKPAFINAKQNSFFGFKSRAPSPLADIHDADVDMERGDVEAAEDHRAEEVSNNNNDGETHSPFTVFYI
jgi:hypothetical protein